jgi:hypothetical protein
LREEAKQDGERGEAGEGNVLSTTLLLASLNLLLF